MKPFFALLLVVLLPGALAAEKSERPLRLLTVGNSFAYNATKFLPGLAKAAGKSVDIASANFTGCSFERHWKALQAAEAGKPEGAIYPSASQGGPKRTLQDFLQAGPWDVITVQQASPLSDDAASYRPFGPDLVAYLKRHAPGAEILIHETWAYRHDDPRFKKGRTPAAMHEDLRKAYFGLAGELALRVIPVGDAFALATARPEWTYQPDPDFVPSSMTYPDVPKQLRSLHAGWTWFEKPGGPKLAIDTRHASLFGQYLGGCVFFEVLFQETPVGNSFVPPGITPEQARALQEIAHQAVSALHPVVTSQ